jgi:hypothetical protein
MLTTSGPNPRVRFVGAGAGAREPSLEMFAHHRVQHATLGVARDRHRWVDTLERRYSGIRRCAQNPARS